MHGSSDDCQDALCIGWNHRRKTPPIIVENRQGRTLALFGPPRSVGDEIQPKTGEIFLREKKIRFELYAHFQKSDRVKNERQAR